MARLSTRAAYDGAAERWDSGATLVYEPLARELVATMSADWSGRRVLDVGAGTGVVSELLRAAGADPVAVDLSLDMLAHRRAARPPGVLGDVLHLPFAARCIDAVVAAFVLNHLRQPVDALVELARVGLPGAPILAAVFSTASTHAGRDRIDDVAGRRGWEPPGWYVEMKTDTIPLLGSAADMRAAAEDAGLDHVRVDERPVDVAVTRPDQLVAYRLGQANFADFLRRLSPSEQRELVAEAIEAVGEPMEPYRPVVVFLSAASPG